MQFCFASVILLVHLVFKLEKARIIGLLMRVCELGTFGMCVLFCDDFRTVHSWCPIRDKVGKQLVVVSRF